MAPLRKPLIGFFSHSLHFGWKGACVAIASEYSLYHSLVLLDFFSPSPPVCPPSRWPSRYCLPTLPLASRLLLSPHLMRPHNNTAVVQLFCYLSQTAGSLHSVFRAPFTCLLRQGNEYHLELQSTTKKVVQHLRLHLKRMCPVEVVRRSVKAFYMMDFYHVKKGQA